MTYFRLDKRNQFDGGCAMSEEIIVPAQIRAARAPLDWSQRDLANEAGVGLTTVRDIETQRRPLGTEAAREIRRVLQNAGIIFVRGTAKAGPGVRFVAGKPHVIKPPTAITEWDGLSFVVEWGGKAITIFIAREAMDDLGGFRNRRADVAYTEVFKKHRGSILDDLARVLTVRKAIVDGHLRLSGKDISALR
jgi:DNA-binding transcriptional regulator YiaG